MGPVRFNASQILCKDGCGFYGNPAFNGYCSKCHKQQKPAEEKSGNEESGEPKISKSADFTKRRFFKSRELPEFHGLAAMYSAPATILAVRPTAIPENDVRLALDNFTARLVDKPSRDYHLISGYVPKLRDFIESLYELTNKVSEPSTSVKTLSEKVREFYELVRSETDLGDSRTGRIGDQNYFVDAAEDCMFRLMYGPIFAAVFSEYETEDLALQTRFNQLASLNARSISPSINANCESMDKAMQALIEIDSKVTPMDKLNSVLEAIKCLNLTKDEASADDLLPALVFALIRSRPPRLRSNYIFVSQFSVPSRLESGQYGYVFTTLTCAMQYIEQLNPDTDWSRSKKSSRMLDTIASSHQIVELIKDTLIVPEPMLLHDQFRRSLGKLERSCQRLRDAIGRTNERFDDFDEWLDQIALKEDDPFLMSEIRDCLDSVLDGVCD